MKKVYVLAILVCFGVVSAQAQTTDELVNDGRNTDNVATQSMGYHRRSHSPLKQITSSNVPRLVRIWSTSLMNDMGELAQPTVYNGVMYVVNGNWTFAIDVATGNQIWRTPVNYERAALRVTTGGAYLRGAATIYNGKLFRQNIDGHVAALDMKTGKELWKTKFGEWKESYGGIVQHYVDDSPAPKKEAPKGQEPQPPANEAPLRLQVQELPAQQLGNAVPKIR